MTKVPLEDGDSEHFEGNQESITLEDKVRESRVS